MRTFFPSNLAGEGEGERGGGAERARIGARRARHRSQALERRGVFFFAFAPDIPTVPHGLSRQVRSTRLSGDLDIRRRLIEPPAPRALYNYHVIPTSSDLFVQRGRNPAKIIPKSCEEINKKLYPTPPCPFYSALLPDGPVSIYHVRRLSYLSTPLVIGCVLRAIPISLTLIIGHVKSSLDACCSVWSAEYACPLLCASPVLLLFPLSLFPPCSLRKGQDAAVL